MPLEKNYVYKRDGRKEEVHLDKITSRIKKLCYGLNMDYVDPVAITLKVVKGLYSGVTTVELDTLAAEIAATMNMDHSDYAVLAARLAISNLQKQTKKLFSEVCEDLYKVVNKNNKSTPLISSQHYSIIMRNADRLNSCIIYDRDFYFNYLGFKIIEHSYLLKIDGKVVERPQHMWMRVAVGIHGDDIESIIETYNLLSEKYYIHGSTTLFAAATPKAQLASSYAISMPDDSLDGIYDCIGQANLVSHTGAGVGINVQNIRAKGTYIAGTNGVSNGLVPMLRVFNAMAVNVMPIGYDDSSITIYIEPWHADIFDCLNLKKYIGKEEYRARDLFYALWVPDLFMKRVAEDLTWSLMCPHKSPGLVDCYGREFNELYEKYELEGRAVKQIPARDLWRAICLAQIDHGNPFILYKDACNKKSNQKNLGTIKGGNFSTEMIQYTSSTEVGVCNIASIAVNKFVKPNKSYDFQKLREVTKIVTKNLNKIIDNNHYPLPEAETSNLRHRPLGIGVQGLADTFVSLRMPYDSDKARILNIQIFETIYFAALEASCDLAEIDGPYSSYENSPISRGFLQYDLWGVTPTNLWNWVELKERIENTGVRNSLFISLMPTSSTAQIMGNNESVEPFISNINTKKFLNKQFTFINPYLLNDLIDRGIWNSEVNYKIISNRGSIQSIAEIPDDLKSIYKTVWEFSQKVLINMACDRGAFIDHSQAMKIYLPAPTYPVMSSMHFYGWNKGLKTGLYSLNMNNLAVMKDKSGRPNSIETDEEEDEGDNGDERNYAALVCSLQNRENCEMCGS